jgi:hypothetical protein
MSQPWQYGNSLIKGLTPDAGGGSFAEDHKPFQFMSTWQMQRQPFEEVGLEQLPQAAAPLDSCSFGLCNA